MRKTKNRTQSHVESVGDLLAASVKNVLPQTLAPKETANATSLPMSAATGFNNKQLSLFQTFLANTDEQHDALSNAIDLWGSVPRYNMSRQAMTKIRIDGEFLRRHEMEFQHRVTPTRESSPPPALPTLTAKTATTIPPLARS